MVPLWRREDCKARLQFRIQGWESSVFASGLCLASWKFNEASSNKITNYQWLKKGQVKISDGLIPLFELSNHHHIGWQPIETKIEGHILFCPHGLQLVYEIYHDILFSFHFVNFISSWGWLPPIDFIARSMFAHSRTSRELLFFSFYFLFKKKKRDWTK